MYLRDNAFYVPQTLYETAVFIDTAAFIDIELQNSTAISCKEQIDSLAIPVYTTHLIVAETYNRLLYDHSNTIAFSFLKKLLNSKIVILEHNKEVSYLAKDLIKQFWDLNLSFCDAVSSVIMMNSGIYKIFTFDISHFQALGFITVPPYY